MEARRERRPASACARNRTSSAAARSTRARTRRSSTRRSSSTPRDASCSARPRRSRPSGTRPRSRSARRSRRVRRPTDPRSRALKAASTAAGERIKALDAQLAETEAALDDQLLRIPNPADPDIPVGGEEANVTVRTWGEQLPSEQPVEGEVGADAPAGGATWTRKPHWELGEALDIIDNARGAKIAGSGFPVYKGAGSALQRGPHQLVPRRPHARARLHRGLAAGRGQRRQRPWHRPDPGQGRPDVRRDPRRPVPGPDRRGPGHEPPSRRDPRGDRAADPLRGVLAVLPARGRRRRQGHARHPARPPVRQGRDGPLRAPRGLDGGPRVDDRARGDPAAAPRARLSRAADEHPRDGLHAGTQVRPRGLVARRRALARGQLVLELPRLPGAPDGDPLPARTRCEAGARPHAQWVRASPWPGSWPLSSRPYQRPDGSIAVPEVLRPYMGREAIAPSSSPAP